MANHTILLIDYEPKSIDKVRRPLTACGYSIEVATDGIAGLEAFHRLKPDLVMIEAMIPKKHGFEVCQEIKKTPQGKRTPIIITTSVYKGRKYRNQAFHIHGCDEYLEKPLDEEQIVTVCRRMLGDVAEPMPPPLPSHDEPQILMDTAPEPPAAPVVMAPAPMLDDDELEILARLDAILPGFGGSSASDSAPTAAPQKPPAPAPAPPPAPPMESRSAASRPAPMSSVATVEEPHKDMFATSFLSSGASAEVANETSRVSEAYAEPAITIEDEAEVEDEAAQVVPFESKRNRKKDRKSKKGPAASLEHSHASAPAQGAAVELAAPIEREPAAAAIPAAEVPFTPSAASSLPDMDVMLTESAASSRPWWVSVAIAVVLLGAAAFLMYVYLGGLLGGPTR